MDEKVEKAYIGILEAVKEITPPERAKAAEDVLEKTEQFFLSPASSRKSYHGCYPGGLAVHTFAVVKTALRLAVTLGYKNISSVIVAAVFHDLGKSESYEITDTGGYKKSKERFPHSTRSLKILHDNGFTLTDEEYQAILIHNGLYTPMGKETANNEFPLAYIIHWADVWCALAQKT